MVAGVGRAQAWSSVTTFRDYCVGRPGEAVTGGAGAHRLLSSRRPPVFSHTLDSVVPSYGSCRRESALSIYTKVCY